MPCKRELTDTQRQVLDFIRQCLDANGFPPTMREICSWFGWHSTNSAFEILERIKRAGAVELSPGLARGIRVVP